MTDREERLTEESGFNRASWIVVGVAAFILLVCLIQVAYRLSLPTEGWLFPFEASEGKQRYLLGEYMGELPTPLQRGDVIVAIEEQSIATMIERAVKLQPIRPANWQVGETVVYSVLRNGQELMVDVTLRQRPLIGYLDQLLRTSLQNLSLLLQLPIAIFIFWRRPGSQAAQLFLLWNAVILANLLSIPVSGQNGGPAELFYRGAYWPAWFFNFLVYPLFIVPFLAHFFLVFPVRKRPMRHHPRLTLGLIYGLSPTVLLMGFLSRLDQPLLFWRTAPELGLSLIFPLSAITAVASLGHSVLTEGDWVRRAQARWLAIGIVVGWGIGQGVLFFLPELGILPRSTFLSLFAALLGLAFPLSLAVTILRYRLFDIDVLINRALVYGALTATLALVYLGSVVLLQGLFRGLVGQDSDLVIVLSTLVIAALFAPLRRRLQEFIDRRFYRRKYNAEEMLSAFSATVRDEVDMDELKLELLQVVDETMQPAHLSLWLKPRADRRTAQR